MSSAAQVSAAGQIDELEERIARLEERLAVLEAPPPQALLFDPFRRLNPTEHRIAELVAKGCTNHEVASRLFFSPKTVEWNLSKIYRKLHVRSRTELAAKLAKATTSGRIPGIPLGVES
jgi:DNA-binding NarL/FixJ family response regulator